MGTVISLAVSTKKVRIVSNLARNFLFKLLKPHSTFLLKKNLIDNKTAQA